MKLAVPNAVPKLYQPYLGLASRLIVPSGELRTVNTWQRRAAVVVAYAVQVARTQGIAPDVAMPSMRRARGLPVALQPRPHSFQLVDLDVFGATESIDLTVHPGFDEFATRVRRERVVELVRWAPPAVARTRGTGRACVYANQLTTALARYVVPDLVVGAHVYDHAPAHQPTFAEIAALVVHVFGEFVARNRDLICRLSATATEAGVLVNQSINTAAVVRKRLGVLKL